MLVREKSDSKFLLKMGFLEPKNSKDEKCGIEIIVLLKNEESENY